MYMNSLDTMDSMKIEPKHAYALYNKGLALKKLERKQVRTEKILEERFFE